MPSENADVQKAVASFDPDCKKPMRGCLLAVCASAAAGHAAAPPRSLMNSRRLIASPEAKDKQSYRIGLWDWKQPHQSHVRFTPKSGLLDCTCACPLGANSGHSVVLVISRADAAKRRTLIGGEWGVRVRSDAVVNQLKAVQFSRSWS